MFTIINHPTLPLFVYYGENYQDTLFATTSCCSIGVHIFNFNDFIGINVCEHCGQVDAIFELFPSKRDDGVGAIYTMINIENVREFAGCETAEECELVADAIVSGMQLAA